MLVEHGFVRAQLADGREWTFTPCLGRVAELGTPEQIVELFAALHGPGADAAAVEVMAAFCDQDDAFPLLGWRDEAGLHDGEMRSAERVILARQLMRHAISGKAAAGTGGQYAREFHAAHYMALARVHLGASAEEAAAMSMSELDSLMRAKFKPDSGPAHTPISRESYRGQMAKARAMREARRA